MTPLLQVAVRHKRAALVWAVLSLSVLLAPRGAVRAAAFCVHDSADLQAALDTAASNGESDEIRVGTGLYLAPVGGFTYNPSPPDANLTIVGGWKPPFDFGCLLNEQNPAQTVLTGNGSGPVMKIIARDGNATLRLLTFEDGQAGSGGTAGLSLDSPINLDPNAHDSYTFTVERNLFVFNQGGAFGGLRVMMVDGLMQVINNVFAWNDASQSAALHLTALGQTLIYVSNNSVLHNAGSGTARSRSMPARRRPPGCTTICSTTMTPPISTSTAPATSSCSTTTCSRASVRHQCLRKPPPASCRRSSPADFCA